MFGSSASIGAISVQPSARSVGSVRIIKNSGHIPIKAKEEYKEEDARVSLIVRAKMDGNKENIAPSLQSSASSSISLAAIIRPNCKRNALAPLEHNLEYKEKSEKKARLSSALVSSELDRAFESKDPSFIHGFLKKYPVTQLSLRDNSPAVFSSSTSPKKDSKASSASPLRVRRPLARRADSVGAGSVAASFRSSAPMPNEGELKTWMLSKIGSE